MLEQAGGAARCRGRLRRRRLECHRIVPSVPRRCRGAAARRRGRRPRPRIRRQRRVADLRHARRLAGQLHVDSAGRLRPGARDAFGVGGPRLFRASVRSMRYLMKTGRVIYESATDAEALDALAECAKCEGILPAIESAHAFFGARRYAPKHPGARILIGCSGRGDKDMPILQSTLLEGSRLTMTAQRRASRPRFAPPRHKAGRRWWVSDRRISAARGQFTRKSRRGRRAAAMSSRSACPSAIRWPTAPPSSARASPRWPTA